MGEVESRGYGSIRYSYAISGDGKVIAIYLRHSYPTDDYNSLLEIGIKILQYDPDLRYHDFFQFIPMRYISTHQGGGLSINYDGTVFAVQHNTNEISAQSIWRRDNITQEFQHDEVLTTGIPTSETDINVLNKNVVGLSPDGKILVGIEEANSLLNKFVIYFCESDINNYNIPDASFPYTPLPPTTPGYSPFSPSPPVIPTPQSVSASTQNTTSES